MKAFRKSLAVIATAAVATLGVSGTALAYQKNGTASGGGCSFAWALSDAAFNGSGYSGNVWHSDPDCTTGRVRYLLDGGGVGTWKTNSCGGNCFWTGYSTSSNIAGVEFQMKATNGTWYYVKKYFP